MEDYREIMDRQVAVYVPAEMVLDMFFNWQKDGVVSLPKFDNIPCDAVPLCVHYDIERCSFYFVLIHGSFEPVKEGAVIPGVDYGVEMVEIENNSSNLESGTDKPGFSKKPGL